LADNSTKPSSSAKVKPGPRRLRQCTAFYVRPVTLPIADHDAVSPSLHLKAIVIYSPLVAVNCRN